MQFEHLQSKLPEVKFTKKYKNWIASRDGAYVLIRSAEAKPHVERYVPLVWYVPGLLLASVASTQFNLDQIGLVILYCTGATLSWFLYTILKKNEILKLKADIEKILIEA